MSYYRSGSHFLHDVIREYCPGPVNAVDEICTDNSPDQLYQLVSNINDTYWIGILNQTNAKYYIRNDKKLFDKCHVIRLTRKDKIKHWISHWFFQLNTGKERFTNTGKFRHNSTLNSVYIEHLANGKVFVPLEVVEVWLEQQTIINLLPANVEIDYSELSSIDVKNFSWSPNRYDNISLSDIFENHKDVENLLLGFRKEEATC